MSTVRARLLLVDDHPLFRAGLRELLDHDGRFVVFGEAGTTAAAIAVAKATAFDGALVDVVVPEDGGPSFVRALHAQQPACKILALSMLDEPIRVAQMLRAGATGYALKSDELDSIITGLAEVLRGARYLSPNLRRAEIEALLAARHLPLEQLTARERGVFDLLVRGDTSAQIAAQLAVARSTIETHRRSIMCKLAAESVVDLIRVAIRHGVRVVPARRDHDVSR